MRLTTITTPSLILRSGLCAACCFMFCVGSMMAVSAAQDDDEETRGLWDTAFLQKRPAGRTATARNRQVRYRSVGARNTVAAKNAVAKDAVVGITFWRMRPSTPTDEVRQLVHDARGEWTPERISADTLLEEGQRVQITIEAPRAGYLYVFDREMYADKSVGEPYLIFPTSAIRGGDNKVAAGRIIEIPAPEDKPPYYTLKRSRPDHEGELLTVLVTDRPLAELTIGRGALKLSTEQFEVYEKSWGAPAYELEMVGGAGTAKTKTEKLAGEGKALLTQADSLPQTIYRVQSKPGKPLLLSVPLRIGKADSD